MKANNAILIDTSSDSGSEYECEGENETEVDLPF